MKRYKKLTLLHSNDLHGDFFSEESGDATIGGASRLSGYVSKVREEVEFLLPNFFFFLLFFKYYKIKRKWGNRQF